jgi:hypothetical protein
MMSVFGDRNTSCRRVGSASPTRAGFTDSFTSSVSYDAVGQVSGTTFPNAIGGLPAETVSTGYHLNGMAQTLTLTDLSTQRETEIVSEVAVDGTGQLLSRLYGNGVSRDIVWDQVLRAPEQISASFGFTNESGSHTVVLQADTLSRDVAGRVTGIVYRPGFVGDGDVPKIPGVTEVPLVSGKAGIAHRRPDLRRRLVMVDKYFQGRTG